ncbi:MAG: hypothetical protein K0R14_1001 [Burkholderiales bacterium]|jgi:nicotinamide mononucleotide adenylyltransferase|nr:hypothetical protein [Burkholderiales bacterium]
MATDLYQYTNKAGNLVISNKNVSGSTKFEFTTTPRHKILQEELDHEKSALQQSQALQKHNTDKNKIDLYSNDINQHEKNISILTKQLKNEKG